MTHGKVTERPAEVHSSALGALRPHPWPLSLAPVLLRVWPEESVARLGLSSVLLGAPSPRQSRTAPSANGCPRSLGHPGPCLALLRLGTGSVCGVCDFIDSERPDL